MVSLYVLYRQLLPKPIPGIYYNASSASSLLGDWPDLARTVGVTGEFGPWFAAQVAKAGVPICQVFVRPFGKPWVLLTDYREAHDILTRRTAPALNADFDKSALITDSFSCLGDFTAALQVTTRGERLKSSRALMQDLMAPSFLHGVMGPVVHDKSMELVRLLEAKMRLAGGRPFSVRTDLDCAALDVILYFAFAQNFDQTSLGPQMELLSRLTADGIAEVHIDEPVTFPEVPAEDFIAAKSQVFSDQIRKVLNGHSGGEARSALGHMLMREKREAEKQGRALNVETNILADELFGEMLAGNHTTGGVLSWLVKYLTNYPHIQAKLRESLHIALPQAVVENRPPTSAELRRTRLPYLDAFIEETLRLNPVPVTRQAIRDTTVLGRPIPKGCLVFLVSNGPGFLSPSLAVDASERSPAAQTAKLNDRWDETKDLRAFDPERWLVRSGDGDANVEFYGAAGPQLAFGLGARGCWGKRLAQVELRTVVALLMWHFQLLSIPEALAGDDAMEVMIARRPQKVFVRLRKA
ncbi:hypothetical protein ABKA04_005813 [Annulohypoxylon sp. FPYF3050]